VLYDCGVVHTKEPFQRLVNQGLILGPVEHTAYYHADSPVYPNPQPPTPNPQPSTPNPSTLQS
jgi:leucyl-tRNA synthetase